MSDRSSARAWPPMAIALACASTALALLVHAHPNGETAYLQGDWVELIVLAFAGLVLRFRRHTGERVVAASVGAVLCAQLAGSAVYAFKRWVPIGGFGGGVANLGTVRTLAAAMTVTSIVAATGCVVVLIREHALRRSLPRSSPIVVGLGVVLIFALPWVLGLGGAQTTDLTSIGAYALLFSLPWGVGVVGSAWLGKIPATALLAAVSSSAALLVLASPLRPNVVEIHNPIAGSLLVLLLTSVAVVARAGAAIALPAR